MIRNQDGRLRCSNCDSDLKPDRWIVMETALQLAGLDGPTSAAGMSFEGLAVYVRELELRWMEDQHTIRELVKRLSRESAVVHAPVLSESVSSPAKWSGLTGRTELNTASKVNAHTNTT